MKAVAPYVALLGLGLVVGAACGDASDAAAVSGAAADRSELKKHGEPVWTTSLPEGADDPVEGAVVSIDDCDFAIGTVLAFPGFPPPTLVFLHRTPQPTAPDWCSEGYVVLGSSAQAGVSTDLARMPQRPILVADFSYKLTPSGEAHSHLAILQVDPFSGVVVRQTGLSAFGALPFEGNVFDGMLELERNGTLVVTGNKNGVLPGEVGSGERYVAEWRHYVNGNRPSPPPPTSITAF